MPHSRNHTNSYQSLLLKVDMTYQLEKLDPKHRPVAISSVLFDRFNKQRIRDGKKRVELKHLISNEAGIKAEFSQYMGKKRLRVENKVVYLNNLTSEPYQVKFINGKVCDANGAAITTTKLKGKENGYGAFVLGKDGQLFYAPHVKGLFHHSSFTSADDVMCSGMINIDDGKVRVINNNSGHYKPKAEHLALMFYLLKCQNVFMDTDSFEKKNPFVKGVLSLLMALHLYSPIPRVQFMKRNETLVNISHSLQQSKFRLFYWIARAIDEHVDKKNYTITSFSAKTAQCWENSPAFRAAVQAINEKNDIKFGASHRVLTAMGAGSPRLFAPKNHKKKAGQHVRPVLAPAF